MPERIANGKENWVDLMHMNIRRTFFVSLGTMRGAFLCGAHPSQPTQAPDNPQPIRRPTDTHIITLSCCVAYHKKAKPFLASTNTAITYDADRNSSEAMSIFLVRMS